MTNEVNTSMTEYNIEFRMTLLAQEVLEGRNDWKRLEDMTGVKAVKWRHLNSGVTRASVDMLDALCSLFPHYAFWLATGLTDYEAGHVAPSTNLAFPEADAHRAPAGHQNTRAYFRACRSALNKVWTATLARIGATDSNELSKARVVSMFSRNMNTSLQLSAFEQTTGLGVEVQMQLLKDLARAQDDHYEELIARIRDRSGADDVIDQQRKRDAEITRDVEQSIRDNQKKR